MKENTVLIPEEKTTLLPFLIKSLPDQSRNNVKSLLTYRQVLISGKQATRHDAPLAAGTRVEISWSKPRGTREDELEVIYEDEYVIAVNKPSGLLSIASDREKEKTAYHMLTTYIKTRNPHARIFVVHRLDKETSGVLLVAKTEEVKRALQDKWNELVTQREYIALVEGAPENDFGTVKSKLRETTTHLMYSCETGGELAITNYEVLRRGNGYSMLKIDIKTGKKNQIRVHMQDMGHPIAGDKKYGARSNPIKRLALHASVIELKYPFTGETLTLSAKIPRSFQKLSIANDNKKD
ncbi:MAG: RluA family pseudouridine synthase [Clostridia bacterium]